MHTLVRKDGKKTYKVRWRQGGVNRSRSFDRLSDARLFDSEVRRRRQAGDLAIMTAGTQSLRGYASQWWAEYAEQHLAERTLEIYALQLDKRITPVLGDYRLRELTPRVVQAFVHQLTKAGVGDASIVKTTTVLQSILKRAEIDGLIERNPVSVVRKPSQRRTRQPDMIPPARVEAIRRALLEPKRVAESKPGQRPRRAHTIPGRSLLDRQQDAMLVAVLAYAGLRPESEALTLTWRQVGKRTLQVNASKTGRERHVRLLAPLAEDLRGWRHASAETGARSLVFPHGDAPWTRSDWRNWVQRIYRPAAVRAGLEPTTRPRDLRGSFASLLIHEGQTVVEVAQQLGHSAAVCLRDYAGVFAEFSIDERTSADEAIRKARDEK